MSGTAAALLVGCLRDEEKGRRLVDQGTPLADGPRPASPGAPFIRPMGCVAARQRRGVGHVLSVGVPTTRGRNCGGGAPPGA